MKLVVGPVMTGRARVFRGDETSAIAKSPTGGPVQIGPLGLSGDEQADLRVHGGADKAIHHYPLDHYAWWGAELGGHDLLNAPGAFGENISTIGITESTICVGDRFRLGTALVEVSHGRQPCWKLDHHFGQKGIMARIVTTARSGWYYRVVESGAVSAGEEFSLDDRPYPEWTVERVFRLLIAGGHKTEPEALDYLAAMPVLAENWRARAVRLQS